MKNYEPAMTLDEERAASYDDDQRYSNTPSRQHRDAALALLAELANGGPALELAIGTGWIALPLAERGIRVDGIDISPSMLDQLRARPDADAINAILGDCADVARGDGDFGGEAADERE